MELEAKLIRSGTSSQCGEGLVLEKVGDYYFVRMYLYSQRHQRLGVFLERGFDTLEEATVNFEESNKILNETMENIAFNAEPAYTC
jgi:hypothetical protein